MAGVISLRFDGTENVSLPANRCARSAAHNTHLEGGQGQADLGSPAQRLPEHLLDLEAAATLHILQSRLVPLGGVRTQTCPDALQDDYRLVC
jgi:hypothetical protein